jgi:hypothetical protein
MKTRTTSHMVQSDKNLHLVALLLTMIIFLGLDQKVAIERVCYQFDQNVYSVPTYENRQN